MALLGSTVLPLILSLGALIGTIIMYFVSKKQKQKLTNDIEELQEKVSSLEIETRAFEEGVEEGEENLFQKNVRELAEKLYKMLKNQHDMENVTTYSELTDVIEEMDTKDEQLKEELLDFYESAIRLEYSNEDLSEKEKREMKETAVDLIKRTGQSLEELE